MTTVWMHRKLELEGYVEVEIPSGMTELEVAQELMENLGLQSEVALLHMVGISTYTVEPAEAEKALAFQDAVRTIAQASRRE